MPHKDKEVRKAYMRAYYLSNRSPSSYAGLTPEQKLELQNKALERSRQIRLEVLKYYGNGRLACVQCSEERIGCLSIDHINGGGNKHRKMLGLRAGIHFYQWLRKQGYPLGFRTLCMNCQFCNRPTRVTLLEAEIVNHNEPIIAVRAR